MSRGSRIATFLFPNQAVSRSERFQGAVSLCATTSVSCPSRGLKGTAHRRQVTLQQP